MSAEQTGTVPRAIGRDLGGINVAGVALEEDGLSGRWWLSGSVSKRRSRSWRVTGAATGRPGSAPPTIDVHVVDVRPG